MDKEAALILIFLITYACLFLFATVLYIENNDECHLESRRIDYIFPAKQVGCWLGEEI